MTLVDQHASTVGVTDACRTLDVSRATWYRRAHAAIAMAQRLGHDHVPIHVG